MRVDGSKVKQSKNRQFVPRDAASSSSLKSPDPMASEKGL